MKKTAIILDFNNLSDYSLRQKTSLITLSKFDVANKTKFFRCYDFDKEIMSFSDKDAINIIEELDYYKVGETDIIVTSNNLNLSAGFLLGLIDIFKLPLDKQEIISCYPNYRVDVYNKLMLAKEKAILRQNTAMLSYLVYYDNKLYTNLG